MMMHYAICSRRWLVIALIQLRLGRNKPIWDIAKSFLFSPPSIYSFSISEILKNAWNVLCWYYWLQLNKITVYILSHKFNVILFLFFVTKFNIIMFVFLSQKFNIILFVFLSQNFFKKIARFIHFSFISFIFARFIHFSFIHFWDPHKWLFICACLTVCLWQLASRKVSREAADLGEV